VRSGTLAQVLKMDIQRHETKIPRNPWGFVTGKDDLNLLVSKRNINMLSNLPAIFIKLIPVFQGTDRGSLHNKCSCHIIMSKKYYLVY
jgi:hypothetical protein